MTMSRSTTTSPMNGRAIHLSLQGKGGVGKSLVASLLAQYFICRGHGVRCLDTDPVNQTLSQYKGLQVEHVKLLRDGGIDQRGFDALMETILTETGTFVVDNGASTFIPLWNYILENNVIGMLRDSGKKLYVHTVVTGGQALADTLKGFKSLAESTQDRIIIVWVNEYFGRVEREGKEFGDMTVYRENEQKIFGSIAIPKRNQDRFGRDVEEVVSRKLTLQEAIASGDFTIMTRQRLKVVQREIFEQLDSIGLI
jgi:hypothetical protein